MHNIASCILLIACAHIYAYCVMLHTTSINSVQRLSLSLDGVTSQGAAPRLPVEIPIEVADDVTDI
jgi:hypothetical protein